MRWYSFTPPPVVHLRHGSADSTAPTASKLASPRAFAVVRVATRTWVVDLPLGAPLTLGRSASSGLCLEAPGVDPDHARLDWNGDKIAFESSRAKSFVNGKPVSERTELMPGDELTLGSAQIVVGLAHAGPDGSRRSLTHDEFRHRLWEEAARAFRGGQQTTLVMLKSRSGDGRRIAATALRCFRASDVVGTYANDELEFLLPDTGAEAAASVVRRVLAQSGVAAVAGMAIAPQDGEHPERVLRSARAALRMAQLDSLGAPGTPERVRAEQDDASVRARIDRRSAEAFPQEVRQALEAAGSTGGAVCIAGQAGAGKSLAAFWLHEHSGSPGSFVSFSAQPQRPIENRLQNLEEAFRCARDGTLVIHEVSDLPPEEQLKVVELSSSDASVRLILTTSRDLDELGRRGSLLPAVLATATRQLVRLPTLQERAQDIMTLARLFAEEFGGERAPRIGLGAIARLQSYSWPGNVLELRNAIERAVLLASGQEILAEHLPADALPAPTGDGRLREHVDSVERDAIIKALADTNHNQTHAAKRLGISRRALIYKLEKYGLKRPAGTIRGSAAATDRSQSVGLTL